jgi:hypothetical protein
LELISPITEHGFVDHHTKADMLQQLPPAQGCEIVLKGNSATADTDRSVTRRRPATAVLHAMSVSAVLCLACAGQEAEAQSALIDLPLF